MFEEPADDEARLDLTPLIDVIFMLVIFFVMTMTFSKPVLDIMLPKSETSEIQKKGKDLMLAVKEDGTIWHNDSEVRLEDLPAVLDSEPEALLNLLFDEKAPFQRFVEIVDVAKVKRGGRFVISTESAGTR